MTSTDHAERLDDFAATMRGRRVVALTGAGVSTESGIPDYRSPQALARPRRPIQGPEFVRHAAVRRRYWARAMTGWERFSQASPGASHLALAALERTGCVIAVVTQNVDRLHQAAGTQRVIELHGALAEVVCLNCGFVDEREAVQQRMWSENVTLAAARAAGRRWPIAPDGDADLPDELIDGFAVPVCVRCSGVIKPNVVFFGHNVPRPIVDEAYAAVDDAEALLVAGTSLAVFSGYRFLRRAADRHIPILIVNRGPVRGEERAMLKIEASAGDTLAALARRLA